MLLRVGFGGGPIWFGVVCLGGFWIGENTRKMTIGWIWIPRWEKDSGDDGGGFDGWDRLPNV